MQLNTVAHATQACSLAIYCQEESAPHLLESREATQAMNWSRGVDELMEDLVLLYFDPTEKQVCAATVYEPLEEDGFPSTIELFQRLYKKDTSIFFFWDHMVASLDGAKEIVGYSFYLIDLPELSQSPLLKMASNVSTFDHFSYDLLLHPSAKGESDADQQFGIAGYKNQGDYLIVLEDSHIHPFAFKPIYRSTVSI